MAGNDIEVLAGIKGGSSVDGESGKNIARDLIKIANQISNNANKRPKIVIDIDYGKTQKNFQSQINRVIGSIKTNPVNVKIDMSSMANTSKTANSIPFSEFKGANVSTKKMSQATAEITKAKKQNIQLQTAENQSTLEFINNSKKRIQAIEEEAKVKKANIQIKKLNNTENKDVNKIISSVSNGSLSSNYQKQIDFFNKLEMKSNATTNSLKECESTYASLISFTRGKDIASFTGKENAESLKELVSLTKDYNIALTNLKTNSDIDKAKSKDFIGDTSNRKAMYNLLNDIKIFETANDKIKSNVKYSELKDIENQANKILLSGRAINNIDVTKLQHSFKKLNHEFREAGIQGQTFVTKIGAQIGKLSAYIGATTVMYTGFNQIKKMVNTVIELDKHITNLQMATGNTRKETILLLNTYNDMAKKLGATTGEVAASADSWLRQGKSIEDTNKMIEASMVLSKVGGLDSAQSTEYLTSATKGYKIAVEDTMKVVDKLSSVDLVSATSAGGLASAMSKTANGARLAGIEMDKLLGMIATVAEVTQADMESVGTTFKTVFARMGNVKLGKLKDEDGNDITTELSDAETVLNRLDIKLRKSATEFNDFGTVFDQIASKWNSLNDIEQSTIGIGFGGVRQKEAVLTLFENYDNVKKYAEVASNSTGSSLEKMKAHYESTEAKMNTFKATFEDLSQTIVNGEFVKGTIDAGSGILGFFTELIDTVGTLPTLITVAAGAMSGFKNKGISKVKYAPQYPMGRAA